MANDDVNITATDKDITIQGSTLAGDNIKLNANENIHITASENSNKTTESSSSSTSSIGATLTPSGMGGINISGTKANSHIKQNGTTYNESTVAADKNLDFQSGKDTDIQGGMLSGEKVTGNVGGNLNIESKQDNNTYREDSSSAGLNIGLSGAVSGSANKGNIDSDYHSVTEQSGIYAGKDGFDINVDKNTDLTGGIISSEANPDKNNLSTGTLTFTDVHNEAAYSSANKGININTGADADRKDAGITPNIGMPAQGNAASDTKATISQGTIEIKDKEHQQQDISTLNRNTNDSLNKLGEIFDKQTIEERQELSAMFGEEAYKAVGDLALKNGWAEGSPEKNALHALVGGIMSELAGGDFLSGASGATVNEMIQDKLADTFKNDPAMHQWASALIGGVVSEIVNGNAQAGASSAASATKDNYLTHGEQQYLLWNIEEYKAGRISEEQFIKKLLYYFNEDQAKAILGYTDSISDDLKYGGEFVGSFLQANSLLAIFNEEGIDTSHGFSYAFQQYMLNHGINPNNYYNDVVQNNIKESITEIANQGFINNNDNTSVDSTILNPKPDAIYDNSNAPLFPNLEIKNSPDKTNTPIYHNGNLSITGNHLEKTGPSMNIDINKSPSINAVAEYRTDALYIQNNGDNILIEKDKLSGDLGFISSNAAAIFNVDKMGIHIKGEILGALEQGSINYELPIGNAIININGQEYLGSIGIGGELILQDEQFKMALKAANIIGLGINLTIKSKN